MTEEDRFDLAVTRGRIADLVIRRFLKEGRIHSRLKKGGHYSVEEVSSDGRRLLSEALAILKKDAKAEG